MVQRPDSGRQAASQLFSFPQDIITGAGWDQALSGAVITSPRDRQAVARMLRIVSGSPAVAVLVRQEMLNNKYVENMPDHRS
jgi:hypothetical protein